MAAAILALSTAPRALRPSDNGIGRVFDRVLTPFGERIHSDETRHRLVIEYAGVRRFIGWEGGGAGEFEFPRGLAFLPAATREASRLFVCDSWNHRIQVFNGNGDFVMAFGGQGSLAGQLQVPSGIAVVRPQFTDDPPDAAEPLLAVAERGNHRIQVFTTDGVPLAAIGRCGTPPARPDNRWHWSDGSPSLTLPTRIRWAAPNLEVECAHGRVLEIDLALAMRLAASDLQLSAECA